MQVGPARRGRVADTEGEISRGKQGCAADLPRIVMGEIQYEERLDLLIALTARVGLGENLRSEGT